MFVGYFLRTVVNSPLTKKLRTSLPLFSEVTRSQGWFSKTSTADSMAQEVHVDGYDAYIKALKENQGKILFTLFFGTKDTNGKSWCPDCRVAEPVIDKCLKKVPKESVLIRCAVGQREIWRDPGNIFRKELNLRSIPTLTKEGTSRKLEEAQCADENLVQMFFEEED